MRRRYLDNRLSALIYTIHAVVCKRFRTADKHCKLEQIGLGLEWVSLGVVCEHGCCYGCALGEANDSVERAFFCYYVEDIVDRLGGCFGWWDFL
jgi:hypothetical protein